MPDELRDHDAGVRITADEWREVERILFPAQDAAPSTRDVWDRIKLAATTSREPHAVNLEYLRACAAALIRAGLSGSDVPPSDLPGKIRQLGELRARAEHQARTLAGEVADLTDRLNNDLPTIFDTVWDEITSDLLTNLTGEDTVEGAAMVHEAGIRAFRLALRLVTDYELRARDVARPQAPSSLVIHPTDLTGHYVRNDPNPAGDLLTGSDATTITTAAERAVDLEPSPVHYTTGPGIRGANDVVTYDDNGTATSLWGIPLDSHHPTIVYLADSLEPCRVTFAGCDGSDDCKRKILGQIIRSKLEGVEQGTRGHQTAVIAITDAIVDTMHDDAPAPNRTALREAIRAALTYTTIFPTRAT